ncbi:MAG TPA: AAA family ATPase [Candidatus Dormibacteraeota bacterium]|nr:AAA family ATPase [Candidatus Dormibacteraeota bacterium]
MSPHPAGPVTFLFTDIEGSTRLWQSHPDTMPEALARHDALARAAIAGQGGHLFKHTGDGVCAAFADAAAALAAAIDLQRALAAADWGDGPRPRVRAALDSGPAQQRDGDYFGPTLNRATRVLAVGAGGQVLATAATLALAPDVEAIDLGLHRLRDLGEPVRVHQLVAAGLAREFPPLRSLDRFRHSLPVLRSSFIGREAELARLRRLLAGARLLTITGVGGCGKTRLALALASQELDRFPDGVFFADLSPLTEPELVWGALAGALGVGDAGPGGGVSPRDVVLGRLTDASALVVLDNCEHLLDACAEIAGELVDRPGAVAILATSREPLGVEGEQVFRVPSLALAAADGDPAASEAVRLFVERAAAADAGFALTPDIAPTVADICRRLDGIPLAIELAAARVRHLSPAEIARRLDDRFRLLTGGPRGARQRQQTLAAALDWSYQLLAERERILLRRCAVFVDGFSLAAAEGVCAGDGLAADDVVDALGALVDKSLVSLHAEEHRYRLLETIRLYAADRLVEAGEADAVRARHLAWFAEVAARGRPDPTATAAPDTGNLRAARAWAHETGDGERVARLSAALYWHMYGYDPAWREERAWCETGLAYQDLSAPVRAQLLASASFHDVAAGDWPAAIAHARAALALEPGAGMVSTAYMPLAVALMVSDPDEADRVIDDGIEQLRRAPTPAFPEAYLASFRLGTALMRGDAARAVALARQLDASPPPRAGSFALAYALHLVGEHAAAEAEASQHTRVLQSGGGEHSRQLLLALTAAGSGRWDDAGRALAAAAAHVRRYRYPLTLNDCVIVCGALAAMEGRLERAAVLLAAVADGGYVRTPEMWAVYLHYRGRVRAGLAAATVRRCRDEARSVDLDRALDEELARHRASP